MSGLKPDAPLPIYREGGSARLAGAAGWGRDSA